MADTAAIATRRLRATGSGLSGFHRSEATFRSLTFGASVIVLAVFAGILIALAAGAWPAISRFAFGFLTSTAWNPVTEHFGALPAIYGTLITSALAMLVAVPVGIGIAIFLTELCPRAFRRPVGIATELLAGVPSIIYGIWGAFVFAPFFQQYLQPRIIDAFSGVPLLSDLFAGPPYGIGIFTASLIVSIMILPFISSVTRDVFETVPSMLKEAAYGLGCTTWEVTWNVVLPYARSGIVGGAMLALGRALGETMAVTFVIGNAHKIPGSLFAPGTTISAAIANEFTEAESEIYRASMIETGLILFFITFVVLAAAQLMIRRLEAQSGGRAQ
jgi:phosphate transport system permease protein